MIRRIAAFVGAVLAVYLLGAWVSTQMVLNAVVELGLPVTLSERFATGLHDMTGMAPVYLPLVTIALLIGFPVAALVMRFVPGPRTVGYALAGAAALFAVHEIMPAILGMHMFPATRSAAGVAWQVAAGAVGGYLFARLLANQSKTA